MIEFCRRHYRQGLFFYQVVEHRCYNDISIYIIVQSIL